MTDDAGVVWRGPEQLRPLLVPIGSLTPDPANANTHPPKNLDVIRNSYGLYGQQKPIVVADSGVVIAGNGAWYVLQRPIPVFDDHGNVIGHELWTHVAASRSDLTPGQQVGYAVTDNRSGELAEWDLDVLASHLGGLSQDGVDLAGLGWDDDDMAALLGDSWGAGGGDADDDDETVAPVECPACGVSFDPKSRELVESG